MDYDAILHRLALVISWLFEALELRGQDKKFLERYVGAKKVTFEDFLKTCKYSEGATEKNKLKQEFYWICRHFELAKLCDFMFKGDGKFIFFSLEEMYLSLRSVKK